MVVGLEYSLGINLLLLASLDQRFILSLKFSDAIDLEIMFFSFLFFVYISKSCFIIFEKCPEEPKISTLLYVNISFNIDFTPFLPTNITAPLFSFVE